MIMTKKNMMMSVVTLLLLAAQAEVSLSDKIIMLENGGIVHTKYTVDSADQLVRLCLEDKSALLSCGEDHVLVLINTTDRIHFDAVWQNGSIL